MSFFKRLNRQQRRKFDKLNNKQKQEIVSAEVNEKLSHIMAQQIAKSFIDGNLWAYKEIMEKYCNPILALKGKNAKERNRILDELINEVSVRYQKYLEMHPEEKSEDQKDEKEEVKEEVNE